MGRLAGHQFRAIVGTPLTNWTKRRVGSLYGTLLDMLVNYFAINLFFFGRFRDNPIFTIDCIRYVNI
jgi:predicted dehydrogenase